MYKLIGALQRAKWIMLLSVFIHPVSVKSFAEGPFLDSAQHKEGIFVLPLLYYTPDTRWAAGAMTVYYFRYGKDTSMEESNDTRLSYIKALADYTQNKQVDLWSSWNIFTHHESYLFKGELRFRNFPDRFYGVGNQTNKEDVELYSYDFVSLKILGLKRIADRLFIGADYQFSYQYNFKYKDRKTLANGLVPGYKGGQTSAFGLVATYDSRDNVINAHHGTLFEVSSYLNKPQFGSTFDYINTNITFNHYREVFKTHVLAINLNANLNTEGVPFIEMAKAGNDDLLRGYARNRFRDKNFIGGQVEYRYPIWRRWGGVAFAGAGDVFNKLSDINDQTLKYSYGLGCRFAINRSERLNIRFDYGWGRNEHSFYMTLTEAF
jgi:outer membrane protein assembly factor BamA